MPFIGNYNNLESNVFPFGLMWLFVLMVVWGLIWKGLALWKSARHGQRNWFIALLIINTMGVLEIIYLAFFQKKPKVTKSKPAAKRQSK
jgi:methionyl-tRNA synthetase